MKKSELVRSSNISEPGSKILRKAPFLKFRNISIDGSTKLPLKKNKLIAPVLKYGHQKSNSYFKIHHKTT